MSQRKTYNKLVRDRIPEIIRTSGRDCGTKIMSDAEYIQALRDKLIEEAQEAAYAEGDELIKELADLYEVIDALMLVAGIDRQVVLNRQQERSEKRGGFTEKLRLLWTE